MPQDKCQKMDPFQSSEVKAQLFYPVTSSSLKMYQLRKSQKQYNVTATLTVTATSDALLPCSGSLPVYDTCTQFTAVTEEITSGCIKKEA